MSKILKKALNKVSRWALIFNIYYSFLMLVNKNTFLFVKAFVNVEMKCNRSSLLVHVTEWNLIVKCYCILLIIQQAMLVYSSSYNNVKTSSMRLDSSAFWISRVSDKAVFLPGLFPSLGPCYTLIGLKRISSLEGPSKHYNDQTPSSLEPVFVWRSF